MGQILISGGTVVTAREAAELDLLLDEGRIAGIFEPGQAPATAEQVDARGLIVLPGAIDAHTHVIQDDPDTAEPDEDEYEGFHHGGRGAAAGGVTCFVEMPHARPATIDRATFRRKRELAERDAVVDFALWGGVHPETGAEELTAQLEEGAAGLKAYMYGDDPLFPGIDDDRLARALETLRGSGRMVAVHAENDAMVSAGAARMHAAGRRDPRAHHDARPPIVEIEAVSRAITLAEQTGGWVHIVHLSTAGAAEEVRRAKARGIAVTAETCPQFLALDLDDLDRLAGFGKCAPPLRAREEVEGLWEAISDRTIDCVTSDHCVFTAAAKRRGDDDIWQAPNGLTGLQTLLPVTLSEGRRRGLSWSRIAELTATAPARLWGLSGRKGEIAPGLDADLALVDPEASWLVEPEDLLGAQRWSPFEGRRLSGRVVRTLRRGETVYELGAEDPVPAGPGSGRFVAATGRADIGQQTTGGDQK